MIMFFGDNSKKQDGEYKGNKQCELGMFGFKVGSHGVCVVYGYNHPESSKSNMAHEIDKFLSSFADLRKPKRPEAPALFLVGDFNCDLKESSGKEMFGKNIFGLLIDSKYPIIK